MTLIGWLQAVLLFVLVWLCVRPVGTYMAVVFEGGRT